MAGLRPRIASVVFVAALSVSGPAIPQAAETQDGVTKGITDFLLDRANDNYMYIFQRKLESNELMKKYLPATLRVAKAGDLRSLLTNTQLWKEAFEKDKKTLRNTVLDELDNLIDQGLCPKGRASELNKPCEEAKQALSNARTRENGGDPKFSARSSLDFTAFTASAQTQLAKNVLADLKKDLDQVGKVDCEKGSYTACVIQVIALLDAFARADYVFNCFVLGNWCWNNQRDRTIRVENDDFDDFRRFVLFFAQMADAANTKDPDRVKVLLKSVTVPPVSFGIKREPHRTRVLITSYLGGAWARDKNENTFVLAVPVGVEISQARDSGNSLSFMLSPIDFGYPLSLKLNGADTRVRTSDILVPAAYVLWGTKNYPVAWGAGYARVRSIETPDKREGRWLILLAFDMPLFKLH